MKRLSFIVLLAVATSLSLTPVAAQQTQEQLAAHYFSNADYEQAAELYESLYHQAPQKFYYQRLLATYKALGHQRDAQKLVERHRRRNPNDLYLWVDLGQLQLEQGQHKKAERTFDEAIALLERDQKPVAELVQAFENLGRHDRSLQVYHRMRETTQNKYLYFAEVVAEYQHLGDYRAMTNEYFDLLDHQPGMMNSVQVNMQRALQEAPDDRLSQGVRDALVSRVRQHPENRVYLEMLVWYALQVNDFEFAAEQAKAVEARFGEQGADLLLRVATIARKNAAYEVATDCFQALQQRGAASPHYVEARVGELEVAFEQVNSHYSLGSMEYAALKQRYLSAFNELGKNIQTIALMRNYATLAAYYCGEVQEGVSMLDDVLELPRLKPQERDAVKLELADLLLFAGQVWDASLLYMQVEKSNKQDALGAEAKLRNAKLSYFNHDFDWALSQLKVLRGSTTKLVANDAMELSLLISDNMEEDSTYGMLALFADADFLRYRNLLDSAWEAYDQVSRSTLSHPLLDEVLLRKAQIRVKQGRYTEADSLLSRLVEFYPYDLTADDALMLRAEINADHLERRDVARDCYERLLLDYPTSLHVDQARKRYNQMR